MPGYVHLRAHSAYSLLEGALPLKKLIKLAVADEQPALGIADRNNLFGALEFSEKAVEAGVQPIIGTTLCVEFGEPNQVARPAARSTSPSIVLIATSEEGYTNLSRLVSHAWLSGDGTSDPCVSIEKLRELSGDIIALTGGPEGPVDRHLAARNPGAARAAMETLAELFPGRLYVELQRHGTEAERLAEPGLVELAYDMGLPLVATNQPFFAAREDFEAHDALICISEGRMVLDDERRRLTEEHYFKSRAEMMELFADLPEALASTVEIARRCHHRPTKRKPILPRFTTGDSGRPEDAEAAEAAELRRQAQEGLESRLAFHGTADGRSEDEYRARLAFELDIIEGMKFPGYFLIVADFIKWAKAREIPVGPGRGSGAGSIVAWALTITDLDPLRFNLLFERFLNPERVSMPDFDIDFCPNGREDVIRYVQEKYGHENVAQIITFGTLQARAVVRDVARVLGVPYGRADQLSKMIPANPANPVTLAQAIEGEPRLQQAREDDPQIRRLLDIALKLEGLFRHASTHAAGVVIGDRPLDLLVPLYKDPRSGMPATQFNMKFAESAGLVKFDFLGLKTLTVIDTTVKLLAQRGVEVDIAALPLDDRATYEMLSRAETVGVFQLESGGMRNAILGMKPDRFEDIIALVALYRPGPMANIPIYNDVKHGRQDPDYIHPRIEPILKETHGIVVYQEQVMQIAQELAGYSLGEADLLRRAMGKKIRAEMDKQQVRFVEGCVERGIERKMAEYIFELLAKFADYGFNKSHAAAYALVAYHTAYLKANYPTEFLAASMTLDMHMPEKVNLFRREAEKYGITVEPPSINRSEVEFAVKDGVIYYSLAALRNVGRSAVEHVVELRREGPFRSLSDFASRVSPRHLNKRAIEGLATAGAFDCLNVERAQAFAGAEAVMSCAARNENGRVLGQSDFFGGGADPEPLPLPRVEPWLPAERLTREYNAIGSFLSGHPIDAYRPILDRLRVQSIAEFQEAANKGATAGRLAGIVVSKQENRTRNGSRMGLIGLSDPTGQIEATIFSEGLSQMRDLLEPGTCVEALVHVDQNGDLQRMRIEKVRLLDEIAHNATGGIRIFLRDPAPLDSVARRLDKGGRAEVSIVMMTGDPRSEIEIRLPERYNVVPQITAAIKAVPGVVAVQEF
ncbi:DNA polymerase III subunit alpha [Lutibaculum baratangense]|uniref:DNA polymerase III subunit alpha n=1 Tax=Lutibaculum baratangense AMV1 TaxID=631454 RepID=V4RIG6_9HYPH|nr:DNA polymerase III subunit alpha [Lutibaculum baratangense]ESR25134.1 DNA polymerase III alpha subunit [Lutibaculum baratangense AMV1]